MKEHRPEWKYVAVLEEKDKGISKVQYSIFKIRSHYKIREFQELLEFIKFEFSIYSMVTNVPGFM